MKYFIIFEIIFFLFPSIIIVVLIYSATVDVVEVEVVRTERKELFKELKYVGGGRGSMRETNVQIQI